MTEAARYVLVHPLTGSFYTGAGAVAAFVFCSDRGAAKILTLPEARTVMATYEASAHARLALRPA